MAEFVSCDFGAELVESRVESQVLELRNGFSVDVSNLKSAECDILLITLAEIESFGELPWEIIEHCPDRYVAAMKYTGIPYRPSVWFRPCSVALRKACSRAAQRLELAGLLDRVIQRHRNRVTHLQLTPAGFDAALDLAGEAADQILIDRGLQRTAWGADLMIPADDGIEFTILPLAVV